MLDVQCPRPYLNNGSVFQIGRNVGSSAVYVCPHDTVTVGPKTRACQSTGQWSGTQPCENYLFIRSSNNVYL